MWCGWVGGGVEMVFPHYDFPSVCAHVHISCAMRMRCSALRPRIRINKRIRKVAFSDVLVKPAIIVCFNAYRIAKRDVSTVAKRWCLHNDGKRIHHPLFTDSIQLGKNAKKGSPFPPSPLLITLTIIAPLSYPHNFINNLAPPSPH